MPDPTTGTATNRGPRPTDERLVDPDVESLIDEAADIDVPDDERVVPEDVNEHVPDDDGRDEI
jgi:hypothetical protein